MDTHLMPPPSSSLPCCCDGWLRDGPVYKRVPRWWRRSARATSLRREVGSMAEPAANVASVRYQVTDVERAVAFYTKVLDFKLDMRNSTVIAIVYRGRCC